MSRLKLTILLILISLASLIVINSNAQSLKMETAPTQYSSVQWNISDGLVDERAVVMLKDVKGFLWFGSIGKSDLSRFDGSTFKKYTPQPDKTEANGIGNIRAIKEDSLHNIWIGADKGLMRYDIRADTFSFFVGDTAGKSDKTIIPFWATKDEMYCLESESRVVSYHIQSLKKKVLLDRKMDDLQMIIRLYMLFDSTSNSLWVPVKDMDRQAMALLSISLSDGKRQYYRWPCTRPGASHDHYVEGIRHDWRRHSIWLNTGDGLMEFSLRDKQFHFVDAFAKLVKLKDYDRWAGLDLDNFGRVWVPTRPQGIIIYDPRTGLARQLFSNPELQRQTAEFNFQVYCDRDDIVWLSHYYPLGIRALLPLQQPLTRYKANPRSKDSLSNGKISSIVPGPNGKLWIGTGDGLNIFDPEREKFEVLREKDLPGFRGKGIIPLLVDTIHQVAWLNAASRDPIDIYRMQMYEMDLQTKICRPVFFGKAGKRLKDIYMCPADIMPIKNGFLFSDDIHGIYELKLGSNIANLVVPFDTTYSIAKSVLVEGKFLFLKVYLTLPNLNYAFKNGQWVRIPHLLDTLEWTSILYDKIDNTFWISLKNELVHFDSAFGKIRVYHKEDGYSGETVAMVMDNAHNLWMANNFKQLCRLDMASGNIYTLSEEDGYIKKAFDWSVPFINDARGSLYLGAGFDYSSPAGLDRIYTEKHASQYTTIPYLRSLTINRKPITYPGGSENIEQLSLSHAQNTIGVECGIIDYYARGKGHIRYKLELQGKLRDWVYPQRNAIQLDDLVPGEYQLTIQASNVGNVFNSLEKTLKISISPPFWETWWFRVLTLMTGIAIVFGIIQYRSRNLKLRNKLLEEKVMLRTNELKHSLEELKETQTQLIQREKMASLGELTAGIAHEIQNPLNFVNNFSEVSAELVGEMKAEMKTGNSDEALNIADDIEANLQKIVRHGKRADAIVRGMLQHSRSSSGEKLPTDINALTDEYLRLSYHGMKAKDKSFISTIQTDFDEKLSASKPSGEKVVLVPQEIGRVLLNLFNNAFYAVGEKKKSLITNSTGGDTNEHQAEYVPTVSVSTKRVYSANGAGSIEIRIRDNGTGIPEKVLNKIYQPFFTTKPTGEGTGLGLSLSYDIVTKMHGGELKVETVEGEWTEFTVQLPI